MSEPTIHDLDKKHAILEERMNTKQSEYKTDISNLRTDMARRDTWLIITGVTLSLAFIGLLIQSWVGS